MVIKLLFYILPVKQSPWAAAAIKTKFSNIRFTYFSYKPKTFYSSNIDSRLKGVFSYQHHFLFQFPRGKLPVQLA